MQDNRSDSVKNTRLRVDVQLVENADAEFVLPRRGTHGAACYDLFANLPTSRREGGEKIPPNCWKLIGTGIKISIQEGVEAQVRSRSGLALKHGISVLNSPGTIDSDYRGEIGVILFNHGKVEYLVKHGDAIAQLAFCETRACDFFIVKTLDDTERGEGGFGSTS